MYFSNKIIPQGSETAVAIEEKAVSMHTDEAMKRGAKKEKV